MLAQSLSDLKSNTREGFEMYTDPSDSVVSHHIRTDGYWSQHEVNWIKSQNFQKPMDIGCHIGYFATIMGLHKTGDAPVILVDASEHNLFFAKRNMELNNLPYKAVYSAVVPTNLQKVYFNQVEGNTGGSHLTTETQKMKEVPAINILQLYNQYTPDFIKIDAEGVDWFLAAQLSKIPTPPTILLEHKNDGYITSFDDLHFTGGKVWDAIQQTLNRYTVRNSATGALLTLNDLKKEPFLDVALHPKN